MRVSFVVIFLMMKFACGKVQIGYGTLRQLGAMSNAWPTRQMEETDAEDYAYR